MGQRAWRWAALGLSAQLAALGTTSPARAHGVWGHVHVTGWAMENLPPGALRDFLAEPEVRDAALFGAAYTDSGYSIEQRKVIPLLGASDEEISIGHEYSEHTHWEPFIQAMITWIRENDPPPWTSLESKKRVAFVLGAASHGLQDEIFDSLFLFQSMHFDGKDQDAADPATDYLLNEQGYLRFAPPKYVPMDTVREVYQQLGLDVSEAIIQKGIDTVGDFYLNPTYRLIFTSVIANGAGNPSNVPWVKEHYLDPDVPGSLVAEIMPTAQHMRALWKRMHGELDANDVVVHAYPALPRRLRSHDNTLPDSWVALIFGEAPNIATAALHWSDADGAAVPFEQQGTRWGAATPRVMRLLPSQPLMPGGWYTAGLSPGATLIGGGNVTETFSFRFQVACTAETAGACADLGAIPTPALDGSGPPPGLWPAEPEEGDGSSGDGASGDGASGDGASGDGASGDGASGDGASGDGVDSPGGANGDGAPGLVETQPGGCSVAGAGARAPSLAGLLLLLGATLVRRRRSASRA